MHHQLKLKLAKLRAPSHLNLALLLPDYHITVITLSFSLNDMRSFYTANTPAVHAGNRANE